MIFGLLCDHVPSILVSQEGQYEIGDMQQKKHVSVEGGASSTV